jgi:CheY-like chemotaxis protein
MTNNSFGTSNRESSRGMASRHGFNVVVAAGGQEALSIVEQGKVRIDLVLSDIVMPGMTGPQLLNRVKQLSPDTKAVLMTGYASPEDINPDVPVLIKPFSSDALLKKIEELLGRCREIHDDFMQQRSRSEQLIKKSAKLRGELEEIGSQAQEAVRRSKELLKKPKRPSAPNGPEPDSKT